MSSILDEFPEGKVKSWYEEHCHINTFEDKVSAFERKGYELDVESGFLFKPLFTREHINEKITALENA